MTGKNVLFYKGHFRSPVGSIEELLKWKGSYHVLERNHEYIQWLFPNYFSSRFNPDADPLSRTESREFRRDPEIAQRFQRYMKPLVQHLDLEINGDGRSEPTLRELQYTDVVCTWREYVDGDSNEVFGAVLILLILLIQCSQLSKFRRLERPAHSQPWAVHDKLMSVGPAPPELEKTKLSSVETDDGLFCLVECPFHRLLSGVSGEVKELATDLRVLLEEAQKTVLSEEDPVYATASDPGEVAKQSQKKKKKKKAKAASSSSSSEESEEEDPANLALALRQKWLGGDTNGGRQEEKHGSRSPGHRRRSRRFALIEKKSKRERAASSWENISDELVLRAATPGGDPLHSLLALQLAQTVKDRRKHRSSRRRSKSTSSGHTSSDSSEDVKDRSLKGHSKAIKDYQSSGKRTQEDPVKYIKRYIRQMEDELGARDRPFRVVDYNKKIFWGKNRSLQRCHYLVSIILELLLKERMDQAALQTVLTLQALHQCSLDGGSWEVAWLLTHVENPFEKKMFGGDPQNLQSVTSYLKTMSDLAKTTDSLRSKGWGKGDQEDQDAGKSNGKGNKKRNSKDNKEKEKAQTDS
eukprot:Skav232094  [mRNA]  locus=scaffold2353:82224:85792:+ [translate_table: standard]